MAHLWLGFGWFAWPRVKLEVLGAIPLAAGGAEGEEGVADVGAGLVAVGARYLLTDARALLVPSVGGGMGVCIMNMEGIARPPYSSESSWIATGLGFVRAGLSLRLGWRVRVNIDGMVGMLTPRAAVDFAGREAASWGRPLLSLAAGLELDL